MLVWAVYVDCRGAATIPCPMQQGKQGQSLWWELDKTIGKGSSPPQAGCQKSLYWFSPWSLPPFSVICLSYLGVGKELGHAEFQGRRKYLLFPLYWRDWVFLLPHLISDLGNEANGTAVFVSREERKIKRMWCNALINSVIIFSIF